MSLSQELKANSCITVLGGDVLNDLEVFTPYNPAFESETVFRKLETFVPNESCKSRLAQILKNPVFDENLLRLRQVRVQLFRSILATSKSEPEFEVIRANEGHFEWAMRVEPSDDDILQSMDTVYYRWKVFATCNRSSTLVAMKNLNTIVLMPLLSLVSPMISLLVPYFVLRYKLNVKIPLIQFVKMIAGVMKSFLLNRRTSASQYVTYVISLLLYAQSMYNVYESSNNAMKVYTFISSKMSGVRLYLQACYRLTKLFKYDTRAIQQTIERVEKESNNLVLYKSIQDNAHNIRDDLKTFLTEVDDMFCYVSIARACERYDMCYSEYRLKKCGTYLKAVDMYHICLQDSVRNSFLLDNTSCLITGPNAAGKSTLIKSVVINVLLAQTFGIACATQFVITPFSYINTQINIPDVKGKDSLFEAEMNRCKSNLDILRRTPPDKKCLFVMDEIFNSTNVVEGIAGAFAILNKMDTYSNTCNIVTTHYLYLTKLKNYEKMKMESRANAQFDYKLRRGVSKQYLAIEMLKQKFPKDVIEEALKIKNQLLV